MKIGFIGLGTMGRPMALNLMKHQHDLTVFARREASLGPLVEGGAATADSPAEVAAGCDVVFTMLTGTEDVESVTLGANGIAEGARPGTVVIDTSTIAPARTRMIGKQLEEGRIDFLDAPVSGGPQGAKDASLSIMVGGKVEVLDRMRPLFNCIGTKVLHMGGQGAGQDTKACHQLLLLITAQGVAEALTLASRAGLDVQQVQQAMMGGMASSRVLEFFGDRMARRDFSAGIESRLYHKDLDIVMQLAHSLGVSLPAGAVTMQFVNGLHGQGHGTDDLSALITLLESLGEPSRTK
jgi:2-hydroxy-3-oxopropionate reductase